MAKSKRLMVGIQHIRIKWLSFKLQYLKALIRICGLIGQLRGSKEDKSIFVGRVPMTCLEQEVKYASR